MRNPDKERRTMPVISKMAFTWSAFIIGIIVLVFLVYILVAYDPAAWLAEYLTGDTNAFVFGFLMGLLPLIGMPISIFLVLVPIIFGFTGGMFLTGALMLFHLAAGYYLMHTLLRPLLLRLLNRSRIPVLRLPARGGKRLAFLFMLFPGLPYSLKNYLLALSGLPFLPYLIIGWLTQFSLSIPFMMLGRAVIKMDPIVLGAAIIIMGLTIIGQYYIRRYYKNT